MASILKVNTIQDATNSNTAMTIDTSGRVLKPTTPHFHVGKSDGHVGASTTIVWNYVVRDTESAYSTSTGKYTVPLTGVWWFGVTALANNTDFIEIAMKEDGTQIFNSRSRDDGNTVSSSATISAAYYATAGVEIAINTQADSSMYGTGSVYSFWTGYLIG